MVSRKTGPLTQQELIDLWKSVTDDSYNEPILEDEFALTLIEQAAAQFARASLSIDRNTQAMFIRPWSGQTQPESAGESKATVQLTFERTKLLDSPLTLFKGMEILNIMDDYSKEGPIEVSTRRVYIVDEDLTFAPGERGPFTVQATAQKAGPGYNLPPPETIQFIVQAGAGLNNTGAQIVPGITNTHELRATIIPDVPVVANIGAYMRMDAGANEGQVRRIVGFANPVVDTSGGSSVLAADGVFQVSSVVGTFQAGEVVEQSPSGAVGTVLAVTATYAVIQRNSGTFVTTETFQGVISNATAVLDSIDVSPDMVAETGTASWTVLSFVDDFGLTVLNEDFPAGGLCGFLDELGNERGIPRANNETDADYRLRVAVPADVVSPNALKRAGNRVLKSLCLEICLREVGRRNFSGLFYGEDPSPTEIIPPFYDLFLVAMTWTGAGAGFLPGEKVFQINGDGVVTRGTMMMDHPVNPAVSPFATGLTGPPLLAPVAVGVERVMGPGFEVGLDMVGETSGNVDNITSITPGFDPKYVWVVMLNLTEFRGFFAIGVPDLQVLESTGFSFDQAPQNAFDSTDIETNHFDADDDLVSDIYIQIQTAITNAKAAGVQFVMYVEEDGCVGP